MLDPSESRAAAHGNNSSLLEKLLPNTVAKLLAELLFVLILGVAGVFTKYYNSPFLWIVLLGLISAISTGFAVSLARERRKGIKESNTNQHRTPVNPGSEASPPLPSNVSHPKHRLYAGVDLGRHQISYGVLRVTTVDPSPALPATGLSVEVEHRVDQETRGDYIYDDLLQIVRNIAVPLDGLGVGLPGQVDAAGGEVVGTPDGWHDLQYFRHELAVRLAGDPACRERLGVAEPSSRHERVEAVEAVEQKIRIDNDVNCAARALLNQHYEHPNWQNFVCLYVGGTGVGGGLVLNRELYYGTNGAAGELGHITVDFLPDAFRPRCECGSDLDTLHLQALVSGDGLVGLANKLDPAKYRLLHDAASRDYDGDDVRALVALLRGDAADRADDVSRLAADPLMIRYAHGVLLEHARFFSIGLATILNMLDLDRLVVGGGVMDAVWQLRVGTERGTLCYCDELVRQVGERTLHVAREGLFRKIVPLDRERRKTYAWQGAALTFCDPSHAARLASR